MASLSRYVFAPAGVLAANSTPDTGEAAGLSLNHVTFRSPQLGNRLNFVLSPPCFSAIGFVVSMGGGDDVLPVSTVDSPRPRGHCGEPDAIATAQPPPTLRKVSMEQCEKLYKRIKKELKTWETRFEEKNGRAPNKRDIAALPHMGESTYSITRALYRQCPVPFGSVTLR